MNESERQLVEIITEQVMAVLREQGDHPAKGKPKAEAPAPIRPPIGVCTGDYSQFPELAGRNVGAPPRTRQIAAKSASPAPPAPHVAALTGIVTANQLQAAMDAAPDRIARLASDARLTPLAADLARQFPQRIERVGNHDNSQRNATWLWWADGACSSVDDVVATHGGRLAPIGAARSGSSLVHVVRDLAKSIKSRRAVGGILFVASAARAMCLANRCQSLRAVLGTDDDAVEQGIRELGANVLILEYPSIGARALRSMIDRFTAHPPQVVAAVERSLAELHRCG